MALVGRVWQTLLEVDPDVCRMVTSPEDLQRLAAQFSGRTALRAARAGSAGDSLGTPAFASAALLVGDLPVFAAFLRVTLPNLFGQQFRTRAESTTLANMAAKKESKKPNGAVSMYLTAYNFASFVGWASVLVLIVRKLIAVKYFDSIG